MTIPCTALSTPEAVAICNQQQDAIELAHADVNSFFIIWASSLVLFMHAGFAMLSAGAVRSKNTRNILISILMDLCVCCIAWYMVGFAFAFGNDEGGFIGSSGWVGIDVGSQTTGTQSFYFWLFQFAFAATAATIVSGAIAERARFDTYLFTSFWVSAWVYPVVVHWVWGGGFLTLGNPQDRSVMSSGVVDFAGCGPVHMVGGMAGLAGAIVMGPRKGRFDSEGKVLPIPGHSSSLATLGTFILWIGWIGFNCGSVITLSGGGGQMAARAGVNSVLSASAAALTAMVFAHFITKSTQRDYDLGVALNGALAGLVSITGCCGYVEMWAAIAIGVLGGIFYVCSSRMVLHIMKVDDPLDATAVHLFCGMWGIGAGAFFANPILLEPVFVPPEGGSIEVPSGIFYGGNTYVTKFSDGTTQPGGTLLGALVANAVVEIVCVAAWVAVMSFPYFFICHKLGVLRVSEEVEDYGIDESAHGGKAYPDLFHPYVAEMEHAKHSPSDTEAALPPQQQPPPLSGTPGMAPPPTTV